MKKYLISLAVIAGLLAASAAYADNSSGPNSQENKTVRLETRTEKADANLVRATVTQNRVENRLENRQENIERILERIASTTASSTATGTKMMERLNNRLEKQTEQLAKVKQVLIDKELKVIEVLNKISGKIADRIVILEGRGLNLTDAKAKLAEANGKIAELTTAADSLSSLVNSDFTASSTEASSTLFRDIKTAQDKIRDLAKQAHALLVDTIKEITKVLPQDDRASSTATTTE